MCALRAHLDGRVDNWREVLDARDAFPCDGMFLTVSSTHSPRKGSPILHRWGTPVGNIIHDAASDHQPNDTSNRKVSWDRAGEIWSIMCGAEKQFSIKAKKEKHSWFGR